MLSRRQQPQVDAIPSNFLESGTGAMSCILRVSGESLDPEALLSTVPLSADQSWRKGEPRSVSSARLHATSGVNFIASEADLDAFEQQVADASAFLGRHSEVVAGIAAFPGVELVVLDFGVAMYENDFARFSFLPATFIQLAAKANIGIEISVYPCRKDDEDRRTASAGARTCSNTRTTSIDIPPPRCETKRMHLQAIRKRDRKCDHALSPSLSEK